MSEWKEVNSSDYCYKITDGTHDSPKRCSDGRFLITSKHIKGTNIDFDNAYFISEEDYQKIIKRSKVDQWDVLISMIGEYCGFCHLEDSNNTEYAVKNVGIMKIGDEYKAKWLYYYLNSPKGKSQLFQSRAGSSQPYIALSALRNLTIPVPNDLALSKIVEILSRYDSLIENYQKQIKLLEEAAQRLYKEWFVDLHFPGHENTKIVDGVPEGWEKKKVNSIIELQSGFAFKSSTFDDNGTYKIVTIKNVKDGAFDGDNVSKIVAIPDKMPKHCILADGDILLSLTGNVGRVCIVNGKNYLLNQRVAKLATGFKAFTYCLFRSRDMFIEVNNLANGAAQQNVSPIRIGEMKILLPNSELLQEFESIVFKSIARIISLQTQLRLLTEARDRLLPKLMSGEIEL